MGSPVQPTPNQPPAGGMGLMTQPGAQQQQPFDLRNFFYQKFNEGGDDNTILEDLSAIAEKDPQVLEQIRARGLDTTKLLGEIAGARQEYEMKQSRAEANQAIFERDMTNFARSGARALGQGVTGGIAGALAGGPGGALAGGLRGAATGAGMQLGLDWLPGISGIAGSNEQPLGSPGDVSMLSNEALEVMKQLALGRMGPAGRFMGRNPGKTAGAQGVLSWLAGDQAAAAAGEEPNSPSETGLELLLQAGLPAAAGAAHGRMNRQFERGDVKQIIDKRADLEGRVRPMVEDREALREGAQQVQRVNLLEEQAKDYRDQLRPRGVRGEQPLFRAQKDLAEAEASGVRAAEAERELDWLEERSRRLWRTTGARSKVNPDRRFRLESEIEAFENQKGRILGLREFIADTEHRSLLYRSVNHKLADMRKKTGFALYKMSPDEKAAFKAIASHPDGQDAMLRHVDRILDNALNIKGSAQAGSRSFKELTGMVELLGDKPEFATAIRSRVAKTVLQNFANVEAGGGQALLRKISELGPEAGAKLLGSKQNLEDLQYLGKAIREIHNLKRGGGPSAGLGASLRPYISHVMTLDPTQWMNNHLKTAFDPTGKYDPKGFAKRVHDLVTSPAAKDMTPAMLGERMANIFKMYGVPTPDEAASQK